MTIITSKANSVVKNAKKLHQKKYRKSSYLIEGWHLFEEAVQAGVTIEKIFALESYRDQLAAFPQTVWVSEDILLDLADSQTPQGIVAVVQKEEVGQADFSQGKFLFLEDVQDPGNVGTIIRTADAAGFTGVIVSDKSADIYSLKTLRSMQGSHFHLPIYRMLSQALLEKAKKAGIPVLATTLSKDSVDYRELVPIENFVLVMGNEGQGISPLMAESADQLVHISPAALPVFLLYSVLNGFTLSFVVAFYTPGTVLSAFVSSALLFFVMAAVGMFTKKDLSGLGRAMMAALIGLLIAMVVNIFLASGFFDYMISVAMVLVFSGLIAWDNQRIRLAYEQLQGRVATGWVVSMALSIYLDFINLFLSILRIFGRND